MAPIPLWHGILMAMKWISRWSYRKAASKFFYSHSDHQGSITHLTDSAGNIANSYIYDSYGRRLTVADIGHSDRSAIQDGHLM